MSRQPADYHWHDDPYLYACVSKFKKGSLAHVEPILCFLERDPYTFGSGYLKEDIWRYLLRVELSPQQQERLRQIALHYVRTRISREFFPMCRCVRGFSTDEFALQVEKLKELKGARNEKVRLRATILSCYLQSIAHGEKARFGMFRDWLRRR